MAGALAMLLTEIRNVHQACLLIASRLRPAGGEEDRMGWTPKSIEELRVDRLRREQENARLTEADEQQRAAELAEAVARCARIVPAPVAKVDSLPPITRTEHINDVLADLAALDKAHARDKNNARGTWTIEENLAKRRVDASLLKAGQ